MGARTLVLILSILLYSEAAQACSCQPKREAEQAFLEADAVFTARVVAQRLVSRRFPEGGDVQLEELVATLLVTTHWKGASTETVEVHTLFGCCMCGLKFEIGEEYLLYAHGEDELYATVCTRTSKLDKAGDDIAYLNERHRVGRL